MIFSRTCRVLGIAFVLVSLRLGAGELPVSIRLTVEPARTLPGLPASLRLVVTNTGDTEVTLPRKLLLRVVPATGEPFIAHYGANEERMYSGAELRIAGPASVPAGGGAQYFFPAYDVGRAPEWFYDQRLHVPGQYRLQVLLLDAIDDGVIESTPAAQLESVVPIRKASGEAILTVDTPTGDDAILWEKLLNVARRHGASRWYSSFWGGAETWLFAKEALEKYPHSRYAAYVVPYHTAVSYEQRIEAARRVLAAQPATANRDDIRLFVAEMEVRLAENAESSIRPNAERAIEMNERARNDLAALEREATDPEVRKTSRARREKLPTPQELQRRLTAQSD